MAPPGESAFLQPGRHRCRGIQCRIHVHTAARTSAAGLPRRRSALRSGLGLALIAGVALAAASPAGAQTAATANPALTVQLEDLDRGVVALASPDGGVFVSWRLLATEVTGSSGTGMVGADFAVYRGAERVGVVTDSTNLHDPAGSPGDEYRVVALVDGEPGEPSAPATASADAFETLPLQKPADGVTPAGEAYTYSANDMSVGDMDGDGDYEYVVKWYPPTPRTSRRRATPAAPTSTPTRPTAPCCTGSTWA